MWISSKISYNGCPLFFQFLRDNEYFTINFTNLKQLFSKKVHKSSFASKHLFSATTKNLEINDESLFKFLENLSPVDLDKISFDFYTENLIFKTEIDIKLTEGFPQLKLKFELDVMNAEDFYANLTSPLLEIIQLLKRNQDELFDIIKKKDLEIAEYILEGGYITHKNIKTEIFNKDEYLKNTFQKYNRNSSDEHPKCYEMYLSPLIEQINGSYPDKREDLINTSNLVKNKESEKNLLKQNSYQNLSSSPAFEISDTSIKIKKKKTTHILKNL